MKKTAMIICLITVLVFTLCPILCHAESAEGLERAPQSFFERVKDRAKTLMTRENLDIIIGWGGSVVSVMLVALLKGSLTKLKNKISGTLDGTTAKTNELIEGYNENNRQLSELSERTAEIERQLNEKCALDRAVSEDVRAYADMLMLVYSGSTTLPEGLKDVLRAKYARLLESEMCGSRE